MNFLAYSNALIFGLCLLAPSGAVGKGFYSPGPHTNNSIDGSIRPSSEVCEKIRNYADKKSFRSEASVDSAKNLAEEHGRAFAILDKNEASSLKPVPLFFIGPNSFEDGRWAVRAHLKPLEKSDEGFKTEKSVIVSTPIPKDPKEKHFELFSLPVSELGSIDGLDPEKFASHALIIDTDPSASCESEVETTDKTIVVSAAQAQVATEDKQVKTAKDQAEMIDVVNMALSIPSDIIKQHSVESLKVRAVGYFETVAGTGPKSIVIPDILTSLMRQDFEKVSSGDLITPDMRVNLTFVDQASGDKLDKIVKGTLPEVEFTLTSEKLSSPSRPMKAVDYIDVSEQYYGLLFGSKLSDWADQDDAPQPAKDVPTANVPLKVDEEQADDEVAQQNIEDVDQSVEPLELGSKLAALDLKSSIFGSPNFEQAFSQHGKCNFVLALPSTGDLDFKEVMFEKSDTVDAHVVDIFKGNDAYFLPTLTDEVGKLVETEVVVSKVTEFLSQAVVKIKKKSGVRFGCEFDGHEVELTPEMISLNGTDDLKISVLMPPILPTFTLLFEVPKHTKDAMQREMEVALEAFWDVVNDEFERTLARAPKAAAGVFAIAQPGLAASDDIWYHAVPLANSEQVDGKTPKIFGRQDLRPFGYDQIEAARGALLAKDAELEVKSAAVGAAVEEMRGGIASGGKTAADAEPDKVIFLGFAKTAALACRAGVYRAIDKQILGIGRAVKLQRIIAITDQSVRDYATDIVKQVDRSPVGVCIEKTETQEPTIVVSLVDRMNGGREWAKVDQNVRANLMAMD